MLLCIIGVLDGLCDTPTDWVQAGGAAALIALLAVVMVCLWLFKRARVRGQRAVVANVVGRLATVWRDCGVPAEYYEIDRATAEEVQREIVRRVRSGDLKVNVADAAISLADPADPDTARTGLSLAPDDDEPPARLSGLDDTSSAQDELRAG